MIPIGSGHKLGRCILIYSHVRACVRACVRVRVRVMIYMSPRVKTFT